MVSLLKLRASWHPESYISEKLVLVFKYSWLNFIPCSFPNADPRRLDWAMRPLEIFGLQSDPLIRFLTQEESGQWVPPLGNWTWETQESRLWLLVLERLANTVAFIGYAWGSRTSLGDGGGARRSKKERGELCIHVWRKEVGRGSAASETWGSGIS